MCHALPSLSPCPQTWIVPIPAGTPYSCPTATLPRCPSCHFRYRRKKFKYIPFLTPFIPKLLNQAAVVSMAMQPDVYWEPYNDMPATLAGTIIPKPWDIAELEAQH